MIEAFLDSGHSMIVTDTEGFLLCHVVTPADGNDCKGIKRLLDTLKAAGHELKKNVG